MLDDTSKGNNYAYNGILNISSQFKTYSKKQSEDSNENSTYSVRFISIDNRYPNSELREVISQGIWFDDYNFIYSVKGRGIFVYNVQNRTYSTIVLGQDDFNISKIENNKLFYDDTSVTISL